jgi:DNA-binding transcriptional regulator YiaG
MPNLAAALKEEISRLARKEIRAHVNSTKGLVAQHRRDIAKLKRTLQTQEKKIAFLEAQERKRIEHAPSAKSAPEPGVRFSTRSVRAQRQRLGLSAQAFGKLAGVSTQTIYHWEQGKSRPRPAQLAALVALRDLGRREAAERLGMLGVAAGRPRKGRRTKKAGTSPTRRKKKAAPRKKATGKKKSGGKR